MTTNEELRFSELTEDFLAWYFKNNPTLSTFLGMHEYDDQLEIMSRQAIEKELEQVKDYQFKLESISQDMLSDELQVDYSLLDSMLKDTVRSNEQLLEYKRDPSIYPSLAIQSVYLLLIRESKSLETTMSNVLARMKQIPELLSQGRTHISNPPSVYVEITKLNVQGAIGFYQQLIPGVAEEVPTLKDELLSESERVVESLKEYQEFVDKLEDTAKGDFAVGKEIFDEMLRENHFLSYDADTLLEKGKELVEDTHRQMKELAEEIDSTKSWQEIIEDTKKDRPEEDDLIEFYRRECEKVKQFVKDQDIVDLPEEEELVIEETPDYLRPLIPYAAYLPPGPYEKKQTGRFWVTPVDSNKTEEEKKSLLGEHNGYSVPVTTLHEGYPGHHLQMCYSNQAPSNLKKLAQSTLFAEGWAFYCEELMEQLGYLQDQKTKLNRLKDQAWRASRIVVDASLHTGRMTVEEAVDYMVDNALLERDSAVTEVRRYTKSPTQPMSYLIGKLEILKIVNEYKEKHGDDFDLKTFHKELLNYGTIPPALIRKLIL